MSAEFFESAGDSFGGGVGGDRKLLCGFLDTHAFEKSQQDRVAVFASEMIERGFELWGNLVPNFVRRRWCRFGNGSGGGFVKLSALVGFHGVTGNKPGALIEPAGEDRRGFELAGFFREDEKDRLRDVFG